MPRSAISRIHLLVHLRVYAPVTHVYAPVHSYVCGRSPPNHYISVISDRWLHVETRLLILFKYLILPKKFPPPTPLLDLKSLPLRPFTTKNWRPFILRRSRRSTRSRPRCSRRCIQRTKRIHRC